MPKNNKKNSDEHQNEKPTVRPPAKTAAQRSREYRARQKALRNVVSHCTATNQPSTSAFINNDADNNRVDVYGNSSNTSTQEQVVDTHRSIDVQVDVHQQSTPVLLGEPSTSTVREECNGRNIMRTAKKSAAKTSTERSREYRARIARAMEDAIEAQATLVETVRSAPRNTSAERTRAYRARRCAVQNAVEPEPGTNAAAEQVEANRPALSGMDDSSEPGIVNVRVPYSDYHRHQKAYDEFTKKFIDNSFGHVCTICHRLWFKLDLKSPSPEHQEIINNILPNIAFDEIAVCNTCFLSLKNNKIPTMSTYNGFSYPEVPDHLPSLDIVSERLISPRIPFMQIRRLRHVNGQYGIYGQVINVPVCVDTMVKTLPRNLDDDHCINVHIKRKKIHKTSYLQGIINKRTIKAWLQFLLPSPLYTMYDIKVDNSFFDNNLNSVMMAQEDVSEHIPIEESLTAQQHTLLWNEDQHLRIAPGERSVPQSLLFDEHAEELSFPSIYLGQFRRFREEIKVTPFMMASSELRRADRRGITPYHLLYMAMKIMRLRVRDSLTIAFKHVGKNTAVTRKQVEDEQYIHNCIESNLAFLRSIPNSTWYWANRKKDLFAMIRQLGKPTIFLTVSANEIGWNDLLQKLYKLKHNGLEISEQVAAELHYLEKTTLVNEDAVTCAIYFNKLVNVLVAILQSKQFSPFGRYYVVDYFKRIEFQHRGSPHAHMLMWLNDAPRDAIGDNKSDAVALIDHLISISSNEASGNIKLQTHKHTFTCYKKIVANRPQQCRFEAPFMPCRNTTILLPMHKEEPGFQDYIKHYKDIRMNLENNDYQDMTTFYQDNNILSDDHYCNILRAGIKRPRVFLKRQPQEKWHNPFNPFVFNIMKSNMDIQFITEEYSCAAYVAEYVNKTNRGVSHLQRQIIETMDEHPEFDIVEVTRKIGINMLNSVEMTSQEAAWYLLREPMSKSSVAVTNISTVWPVDRQRIRKTQKELDEMGIGEDSTDIWKNNWFDKYERRHEDLSDVTLAQFVSNYNVHDDGTYKQRKKPRIIRYRNYDMESDLNEYKREMVTLHFPFRNEDAEILSELKFIQIYDENENLLLNRQREFQSDLDIQKTIEICREICRVDENPDETEIQDAANRNPEPDPFQRLYNNPDSDANADIRLAVLNKLGAIAKRRENLMPNADFCNLMRMANEKQSELLRHVISHLLSPRITPFQIFLTGPAGCGKTFVIKLIMDIYNRFTNNDGHCNAYIACASTGKAAVAIDGTTIHTALKISLSKLLPLSIEVAHQYRALFKYVKVIIIDEVSMIGAELLEQIDARLKQITGDFVTNFGGLDVIFIGDLRQLPPVRATPIYKQQKQKIVGPILWRGLKFYELEQVMRQANVQFSSILTKIGNGEILENHELELIESRFCTVEEADDRCPHGIRLFNTNQSVNQYNNKILNGAQEKIVSTAKDVYIGCTSREQEAFVHQKLHKMSIIDTGGLPYEIIFVKDIYYMITTNIDVADGLANGAVGKLVHIEQDDSGEVSVAWLVFPNSSKVGAKIRKKVAGHVAANNILKTAVPIGRRSSTIALNNNKTINAKRSHLPLICACATTIHKSQGSTYDEIVYEYDKKHSQSLVYVALSRVTNIEGLWMTTSNNDDFRFYHGRRASVSTIHLQDEFRRLSTNCLETIDKQMLDFINQRRGISLYTLNCQSLRAHSEDLTDVVIRKSNIILLTETWLNNDENVNVPNFNCVIKYKRRNIRAGGVAIYHNQNDTVNLVTPNIEMTANQSSSYTSTATPVGDVCLSECKTFSGQIIIVAAIYISPNQNIDDIIYFIHRSLLAYSRGGAAILGRGEDKLPMILGGDFNVNFQSDDSLQLVNFLLENFGLRMSNNPNISTTKSGTTIDALFSRHLDNIESRTYISYFSYHKPIVSAIKINEPDEENMQIEEIN